MNLNRRIRICKEFPAYKFHELDTVPARDLVRAMALLDAAEERQTKLANRKTPTKE